MAKGIFIPDITVEMMRKASLEAVETLLVEGEMYDVDIPKWIPCSEKQPGTKCDSKEYMVTIESDDGERHVTTSFWQCYFGSWSWNDDGVIAWRELPEPYGGESE